MNACSQPLYRLALAVVATACFLPASAHAQSLRDPAVYMTHIGDRYDDLSLQFYSLLSAVAHSGDARKTEDIRQQLLRDTRRIYQEVAGMPPFQGDAALRDSAAAYLRIYQAALESDYDKLLELEVLSGTSADKMEAYLEAQRSAREKLVATNTAMRLEQQRFAEAHGLELSERQGELYDKIRAANEALAHLQRVYLLFYGPHREEARLLEALDAGNLDALMEIRGNLARQSIGNSRELIEMVDFQGDASLVDVCREFNAFYLREAETGTPAMIAYLQAKLGVTEARQRIDETEGDPPSGYIEAYNEAVRTYNQAAQAYNAVVERHNLERTRLTEQWKLAFAEFLARHIPRF